MQLTKTLTTPIALASLLLAGSVHAQVLGGGLGGGAGGALQGSLIGSPSGLTGSALGNGTGRLSGRANGHRGSLIERPQRPLREPKVAAADAATSLHAASEAAGGLGSSASVPTAPELAAPSIETVNPNPASSSVIASTSGALAAAADSNSSATPTVPGAMPETRAPDSESDGSTDSALLSGDAAGALGTTANAATQLPTHTADAPPEGKKRRGLFASLFGRNQPADGDTEDQPRTAEPPRDSAPALLAGATLHSNANAQADGRAEANVERSANQPPRAQADASANASVNAQASATGGSR